MKRDRYYDEDDEDQNAGPYSAVRQPVVLPDKLGGGDFALASLLAIGVFAFAMLLASGACCVSHALQLRKRVSPSSHWFVSRLNLRSEAAIVKLATVEPLFRVRSSGSRVRLPTMVMIVSPAMGVLLSVCMWGGCAGGLPDGAESVWHDCGREPSLLQPRAISRLQVTLTHPPERAGRESHPPPP